MTMTAPDLLYLVTAVAVIVCGVLLLGHRRCGVRPSRPWKPPRFLSVVIPTLNEENRIGGCLGELGRMEGVSEIIVSDGGSADATRELARAAGAVFVSGPRGRGCQIKTGIDRARGDVVLVLHADTRLDPAVPARIMRLLEQDPLTGGGACAMRFDHGGAKLALIAGLNNWRARLTGIAFGDQGQFFRTEALVAAGGFPDLMLMEDVELSLRLGQVGYLRLLPVGITASDRRWSKKPVSAHTVTVVRLFGSYLLARRRGRIDPAAKKYYSRYYGSE